MLLVEAMEYQVPLMRLIFRFETLVALVAFVVFALTGLTSWRVRNWELITAKVEIRMAREKKTFMIFCYFLVWYLIFALVL